MLAALDAKRARPETVQSFAGIRLDDEAPLTVETAAGIVSKPWADFIAGCGGFPAVGRRGFGRAGARRQHEGEGQQVGG